MTDITLRAVSFGDPTAEGDEAFLFDRKCFLPTEIFERCAARQTPLFVVGRRGSGKSAMRLALARTFAADTSSITVPLAPQGFHLAHAKSIARLLLAESGVNWEFLFTSVWAVIFRTAWAEGLLNYYRLRASDPGDLEALRDYVGDAAEAGGSTAERLGHYLSRVSTLAAESNGDLVGRVQDALRTLRSERMGAVIKRVTQESNVRLVALVDGLDENWDGSDISAQLINGLLTQLAGDYATLGAVSCIFIRENMYRRVGTLSARWDRIEGYFTFVNWSAGQLKDVALTRVRRSLGREDVGWSDVFENTVEGVDTIDYMISHTQAKPRELILFCRYALTSAIRNGNARIMARDVKDAERIYSENRYRDLINEYKDALPELKTVLDTFVGQPVDFSLDELFRNFGEFMVSGRYAAYAPQLSLSHPSPPALFDLLVGLGFLGVRLPGSADFVFKYYGQQGNAFSSLGDIQQVAIHPAFAVALGAAKPAGVQLPVREVEDKDLVSAAGSVAVRTTAVAEKATQLVSELRAIPLGMGGFRRYEEQARDALAYAFTGYLDNPRLQERNWSGTQVRDVVFDNTGETLFFKHMRDKYDAVTFVFECKNKADLDAADFHQIEARLSDGTGNFGVICYRSQRVDPIRSEIEQIRSIFNRSLSRKVVILLSDANLNQILGRRMKGKLDEFMYRLLTRYLSVYLSN